MSTYKDEQQAKQTKHLREHMEIDSELRSWVVDESTVYGWDEVVPRFLARVHNTETGNDFTIFVTYNGITRLKDEDLPELAKWIQEHAKGQAE